LQLLREPLLQFLFLGGLIYLAYAYVTPETEDDRSQSLIVNAAKVQWMQESWQKRWNRLPTKKELDGLIEQYVKESILYNEAVKMGLDKDDTLIRRQLAKKVEFLAKDLVVYIPPNDEELQSYFKAHKDNYKGERLYSFTQIFFDPDKRGNATLEDAKKSKEQLVQSNSILQDTSKFGDVFMTDSYFEANTPLDIRKNFGSGFMQTVIALEPGKWQGPILSGFGVHLVYLKEIISPAEPEFEKVKDDVLQDWTQFKQEQINQEFYRKLKDNYVIIVEDSNVSVLDQAS